MALTEEEVLSVGVEATDNNELISLLRPIKKDGFALFMKLKYDLVVKTLNISYQQLCSIIIEHTDQEVIIKDILEIGDCCKEVDHESFAELCDSYKVDNLVFNEPIQCTVVRCYLQKPLDLFHRMKIIASVNKDKNFEVLSGKEISKPIDFNSKHKAEVSAVLEELIEKGRKYIINTERVKNEIIMTAHFEQRKRTFTTISQGKRISTITVSPASKAEAKYDIISNRIQLKCGPNRKIKQYILSTFGQVFFKDNTHFSEQGNQVYKLEKIKADSFSINLDEELLEELESASIIEEIVRFPYGNDWATIHLKSRDVESLLTDLSNDKFDLKSMERVEVTLELRLKRNEDSKSKAVKVTVTSTSKVSYDPQYTPIVNKCLTKWGIQIGEN
ncbi:hypothetical protein P4H71_11585 [Paenibacillus kribbensis]|uniref:hypothetical protein n=1 Tax=Paenibacillus kribbensis TaxID=172713 RepID=UPI002DBE15D8|nr:hypothetical protein [Paenibacillus kribbensis]MEC0234969.1 hypothetical protein [Paenibacillus kribbensis]